MSNRRAIPTKLTFGVLAPTAAWFIVRPFVDPPPALAGLYTSIGCSIVAFITTLYLVPALGDTFIRAGLKGKDLLKIDRDEKYIPESMGLVCASVYILLLILFIPFAFSNFFKQAEAEGLANVFPHFQLSVYLSSVLAILLATFLGFLDDVFDIRWRYKIPIPIIASIPLLLVYYAERGNTNVVVPIPLRFIFGTIINLGPLYYVYMSLLSTFATNSINILAGINGSEASQALIIALSVILNDMLYLPWSTSYKFRLPLYLLGGSAEVDFGGVWSAGMAHGSTELVDRHLFSLYFMLPLVGVCLGFLYHNWYPARAFPGDTLCYVTGMAFAVVGIQAHFSKTLLLFFIPQIFNFIISCPQLFGIVPCPRHRVPRFDKATYLLYPSVTSFLKPPNHLTALVLKIFSTLRLTTLTVHPKSGVILESTNLTILNFLLIHFGPMSEKSLVETLIGTQLLCSVLAFVVRYGLAWLVYDGDRR